MKKSKGQLRGSQSSLWLHGGWPDRLIGWFIPVLGGKSAWGLEVDFYLCCGLLFLWCLDCLEVAWRLRLCYRCRSFSRNLRRFLLLSSLSLSSLSQTVGLRRDPMSRELGVGLFRIKHQETGIWFSDSRCCVPIQIYINHESSTYMFAQFMQSIY